MGHFIVRCSLAMSSSLGSKSMKSRHIYMNSALISCLISALLAAGFCFAGTAPSNFEGTWVLDKSKSKDLPRMLQNVESYSMVVTQDAQQLTVDPKLVPGARRGDRGGDRPEPSGGGVTGGDRQGGRRGYGGGGRRGARLGFGLSKMTYKLDGTESIVEIAGTNPGEAKLRAKLDANGKVLELTNTRNVNFQGNEVTITTREEWELTDGGRVLRVQRTSETPRGAQESTLIFNKQ
jgi:hypothetical protein